MRVKVIGLVLFYVELPVFGYVYSEVATRNDGASLGHRRGPDFANGVVYEQIRWNESHRISCRHLGFESGVPRNSRVHLEQALKLNGIKHHPRHADGDALPSSLLLLAVSSVFEKDVVCQL